MSEESHKQRVRAMKRNVEMYSKYILLCESRCRRCTKKKRSVDLVVAFCGEDLSWLANVTGYRRIFVYSKCGKSVPHQKGLVHRTLPNIGSCDYVYLQHIIREYTRLPDAVEFSKGTENSQRHCELRFRRNFWTNFATWVSGVMRNQRNFSLDDYQFSFHNSDKFPFLKSKFESFEMWCYAVFGGPLTDFLFDNAQYPIFGGYFSLTKKQMHAYSKGVYELMQSYQKAANEEVDHFIERTWGLMFTIQFTTKRNERLMKLWEHRVAMKDTRIISQCRVLLPFTNVDTRLATNKKTMACA